MRPKPLVRPLAGILRVQARIVADEWTYVTIVRPAQPAWPASRCPWRWTVGAFDRAISH